MYGAINMADTTNTDNANNIQRNHQQVQQNRQDIAVSRLSKFVFSIAIFLNFSMFTSDIVILIVDWKETCNVPIKYWILVSCIQISISTIITIYKYIKGIRENDMGRYPKIKKIEGILSWIFIGVYVWGWIWWSRVDSCDATHLHKLMLAHLIINTIFLGIGVVLILLICICLPFLIILDNYLPSGNNGVDQDILDQMFEYEFRNNGVAQAILDIDDGTNIQDVEIKDEEDRACCICLQSYQQKEKLRVLNCKHNFHKDCCDEWLKRNNSCPLCRAPAIVDIV